jgi:hypothetical protein
MFKDRQYHVDINHSMTILTGVGNSGHPDNQYVIVDDAFVVIRVLNARS